MKFQCTKKHAITYDIFIVRRIDDIIVIGEPGELIGFK